MFPLRTLLERLGFSRQLGLIVAIPALFAYNMLNRRIDSLTLDMTNFASELEATFVIDYVEAGGAEGESGSRREVHASGLATTH